MVAEPNTHTAEQADAIETTPGVAPPLQARSRRTLERLARAALFLFEQNGVAGTSVQDIVDRAGSSVGSFYARFGGKDDLVRYLEHRFWQDAGDRWDDALERGVWNDAELAELVERLVHLFVEVEEMDAAGRRAFGRSARSESAADFRARVRGDTVRLLLARRDSMVHPAPEIAADLLPVVLTGTIAESRRIGESDAPGLVPELVRMCRAWLGCPEGGGDQPAGGVDFFDVWG